MNFPILSKIIKIGKNMLCPITDIYETITLTLKILGIVIECQGEAQKKLDKATRPMREIKQEFPRQFARDAIGIDLLIFFRDNLAHAWFDLRHELVKTLIITKLAYSSTAFDPFGTMFFSHRGGTKTITCM